MPVVFTLSAFFFFSFFPLRMQAEQGRNVHFSQNVSDQRMKQVLFVNVINERHVSEQTQKDFLCEKEKKKLCWYFDDIASSRIHQL